MKALVGGASGFTGEKLLKRILSDEDYNKVYALVRTELPINHSKLEQIKVDFDHLTSDCIPKDIEVGFCCIGTTIRKAQTKDNFRRVDYEYITKFAKVCEKSGIKNFHLISAIGASPESYFFYQRVKGEAESFINSLEFESVTIYRPSVIYGGRNEFRLFESFAAWISRNFKFLFVGKLNRILAVTGDQLAKNIHLKSKQFIPGRWIIESEEIL
ncbi:MAG: NAD(P)H-binding protein [Marinifilum sp.]|jgi:uncharacterized protein YbjT (DUF2867 family)|nr:NAD(P)H-binding protein [Marinifilum sp.]